MRPEPSAAAAILVPTTLAPTGPAATQGMAAAVPPTALSLALGLSACGNPMLTGAGLGGAIGSPTGDFGWDALVGVGAPGGYLHDQSQARS